MFTYVKLKNFMSFREAVFDFRNGRKGAKKFISIYGENGSGKSNFVTSIDFLRKTIESFHFTESVEKIMEFAKNQELPKEAVESFLNTMSLVKYRENCRMIACDDPTTIEYGFQTNGHEGYYVISFKERFLYEKLYYFSGKQRGTLYEIDYTKDFIKTKFANSVFKNKKVEEELKEEISKYWGKHTLLGILNKEREEKNESYIQESYLKYLFDIIYMLRDTTVNCQRSSESGSEISSRKPTNILHKLDTGRIRKKNEKVLNCTEKVLKDFFTQAYADIKDVYYERLYENDIIKYKLYVRKMIGGKIRDIDFSRESAGTQHILAIIRALMGVFCGITVVYDEIDDGIHDLLLKNVLESMLEDITGQLIITTHNTYMLESIDIKSVYLITVDYLGNKDVRCLDQYPRIQGTNNPRLKYLKGLFGGIPNIEIIDYGYILNELNDSNDSANGGK